MTKAILSLALCCYLGTLKAEIKLPALVGNNMVLQREKPIKIWGYAAPQEKISIQFNGKTTEVLTATDGKWTALLPKMKAGGPYKMTLTGENKIDLDNILIGDVWICSGQSNMEFALESGLNADQEIANANYPNIRLFSVDKKLSLKPESDTKGNWSLCTPETARHFSAIGYFFARQVQADVKIPIGLINASWGGTVIESWISTDGLANEPTFGRTATTVPNFDLEGYNTRHKKLNEDWVKNFNSQDQGFKNGQYLWADVNPSDWSNINLPNGWEFAGIKELMDLDGVVWFSKQIELSDDDLKGAATLNLGVIQNAEITFINGQQVGQSPDVWGLKRNYNIPVGILKKGMNNITVRVENYGGDGGFSITPKDFNLQTAAKKQDLSGNWKYKIGYRLTKYDRPEKELGPNTLPTLMYNTMIYPVINYGVKGVLWYQGESNWERGFQYRSLFPMMIADWRKKFNHADLPFLYVQLANYHQKLNEPGDSYQAEVREAQDMTQKTRNAFMTTAIDVGDAANIHPKDKQTVGLRLAKLAEQTVYKMPVKGMHPAFNSYKTEGNAMFINFKNAEGLKTKDNKAPGNFQIAGADHKFYWAKAVLLPGNKIKVYTDKVSNPVALRYAWEDNPAEANVVNAESLPLFPFRTDNWKGLTDTNK
jgi:sialate O-acetylesterase